MSRTLSLYLCDIAGLVQLPPERGHKNPLSHSSRPSSKEATKCGHVLAAIVKSSEDAIIGADLQGIITSWNKGAERLYGYTAEEVMGKPVSLLHPPEQPSELPDLLDVSRILRGKVQLRKERLDLGQLARTVAEDRRPILEQANLTLGLTIPETPVWVMGNRTRLMQILNNLLDNAVKFANGGHQVTVRVRADEEHRQAVLSVQDEGIGIEPEILPRLFSPFLQADHSLDRSRGGLGLGLAMVKELAELHEGSAEAFSEGVHRGSEFTIRLPLEQEPAALSKGPLTPQSPGKHLRIVVIEDNRDCADSLRMLLQLLGHDGELNFITLGCE